MSTAPVPADHGPTIDRPATLGAVRRALPERLRSEFDAARDALGPDDDLFGFLNLWGGIAQGEASGARDSSGPTISLDEAVRRLRGAA